jgi:hypothetical protein
MNHKLPLALLIVVGCLLLGCDAPPPVAAPPGPPAPPPPAAPAPKAVEPPPKPAPDPYGVAVAEIVKILQRYPTVYGGVSDAASADKAIEEIGRLTARLRELSAQIAKLPHRPGQHEPTLALQAELTRMQTAQLTNADMQRVLADPDLQVKFVSAHQSFALEGLGALAPALITRMQVPPEPAPAVPPPGTR